MDELSVYHQRWSKGDQKAYYDIFWIMQHFLNITWGDLHQKRLEDFPSHQTDALSLAITEYKQGKPLAYIVESVYFNELLFKIREGVLIPRADTEPMVSYIISKLSGGERLLELGIGSGAISCSIAKHCQNIQILGIDIAREACELARENAKRLGVDNNIEIRCESWFDLNNIGKFDWVISNPPYIAKGDTQLEPSVLQYEPTSALIAENEGFSDLLYIAKSARQWLVPGGRIALEHGFSQQEKLSQILSELGYSKIVRESDKYHPRFLVAQL